MDIVIMYCRSPMPLALPPHSKNPGIAHEPGAVALPGRRSAAWGRQKWGWLQKNRGDYSKNGNDNGKNGGKNGKNRDDNAASDISRLLGAAKLQSTPDADNPRYATD